MRLKLRALRGCLNGKESIKSTFRNSNLVCGRVITEKYMIH